MEFTKGTADRLLSAMVDLDKGLSGYQVTRLGHSIQSATRAFNDGADVDWIVSALLHDIGDIYAPYNHDEYAAAILRPLCRTMCLGCGKTRGFPDGLLWAPCGGNPNKRDALKVTHILTIARNSANAGINPVSIQITTANRYRFLPAWCKRSFLALLMIRM